MLDKEKIQNPLVSYITIAPPDDSKDVRALIEFLGVGGSEAVVEFDDFDLLAALAELFWEAAVEVNEGRREGIDYLIKLKGHFVDAQAEGKEYTVEHFLDGETPGSVPKVREDIRYPWYEDHGQGDEI